MADPVAYARFLVVFCSYTRPGEWVTAGRLARRILPTGSSEFQREVARKLSNLNRFGHLDRRRHAGHPNEYCRPTRTPIVLPPELHAAFRFSRTGIGRPIKHDRQLCFWLPDPSL